MTTTMNQKLMAWTGAFLIAMPLLLIVAQRAAAILA